MTKKVILTGIRANNQLHIGNYFGALLPIVDMAKKHGGEYQVNLFMPDLHSFTTPIDHSQLKEQILSSIRTFVAAGLPIDNPDVHIYRQSYVPAHSELTVILNCFTGFGELRRMEQFETKSGLTRSSGAQIYFEGMLRSGEHKLPTGLSVEQLFEMYTSDMLSMKKLLERHTLNNNKLRAVTVGLFDYPVLMACDVLLYGAEYVPVGDDQSQHIEFMRDIAERMNTKFNQALFKLPLEVKKQHEFFGKDQGLRIKDLIDPSKKMSKSDDSGRGIIFLTDEPTVAAKKIMGATTDSIGEINLDYAKQPGISNLLQILALFTARPLDDVIREYQGQTSYGDLKKAVSEATEAFLNDFQANYDQVDMNAVESKLTASEAQMNKIANQTLHKVQKAIGLR